METVLVTDADSLLGRMLCSELIDGGFKVIGHVRGHDFPPFPLEVTVVVASEFQESIAIWNETVAPINHVVFGQSNSDGEGESEVQDFGDLVATLDFELTRFLAELQASGKLLMRNDGGQIWVLTQEDSMSYYTSSPSSPIRTRAQHGAVKSFAKELFRFGVRLNCANIQLLAEQTSPEDWQAAGKGLKAFAMKFKPNSTAAIAKTLRCFLEQPDLPVAGMIVPIGIGFPETNV